MTTTTGTDTASLVTRYLELNDAKAAIDAEMEQIKANLRTLGAGSHEAGEHTVSISVQRRFDPTLAQAVLDADTYASLCTAFDSKKAKATLPPALYDTLMSESGEPRVVVK